MSKLEMQQRSLETLRQKVSTDRTQSENVAMEQLDIRNELLTEMEKKVLVFFCIFVMCVFVSVSFYLYRLLCLFFLGTANPNVDVST
jgi:hypothetical protein